MNECQTSTKKILVNTIMNSLVNGKMFTREGNGIKINVEDVTQAMAIAYEKSAAINERYIVKDPFTPVSAVRNYDGEVYIVVNPSEKLVNTFMEEEKVRRLNEDAFNLQEQEKERGGYTENEMGEFYEPQVKEGVDFVFEKSPELSKVGTQEQYSNYLNTIFPNSQVKDIVYHGTNKIARENILKEGFKEPIDEELEDMQDSLIWFSKDKY